MAALTSIISFVSDCLLFYEATILQYTTQTLIFEQSIDILVPGEFS